MKISHRSKSQNKVSPSPSPKGVLTIKDMRQHAATGQNTTMTTNEFSSKKMQASDNEVVNILPYLRKLAIDAKDWERVMKTPGITQENLEGYFERLIEDRIKDLARNPELLASLSQ